MSIGCGSGQPIPVAGINNCSIVEEPGEPMLRVGDISLDVKARTAYRNGNEVPLTATETRLLATLMRQEGEVVSIRQLMRDVWNTDYLGDLRTLRYYVYSLRQKIGATEIVTYRRRGYALMSEKPESSGTVSRNGRLRAAGTKRLPEVSDISQA
jgi:DNA-binding winged helix-turn-helix (wHTH) protein